MGTEIENHVCGRCRGEGLLPCFSHVIGGVCFRCWGCGKDPRTLKELDAWLVRARQEYASLRRSLHAVAPQKRSSVAREMAFLASLGKRNRERADALRETFRLYNGMARAKAKELSS